MFLKVSSQFNEAGMVHTSKFCTTAMVLLLIAGS